MEPLITLLKQRLNGMDGWEFRIYLPGQVAYGWSAGTRAEAMREAKECLESMRKQWGVPVA